MGYAQAEQGVSGEPGPKALMGLLAEGTAERVPVQSQLQGAQIKGTTGFDLDGGFNAMKGCKLGCSGRAAGSNTNSNPTLASQVSHSEHNQQPTGRMRHPPIYPVYQVVHKPINQTKQPKIPKLY